MILAIVEGAPDAFLDKKITVIHGDITAEETIHKMKEVADDYGENITTIYFTNIFNDFKHKIVSLYSQLSTEDILLICDHGDKQHVAHTKPDAKTGGRKTKRRRRYKRTIRF
jgi:phosphopentomutase